MDYQRLLETTEQILTLKGGRGSGNWGHVGRKGKRGGSGKGGGLGAIRPKDTRSAYYIETGQINNGRVTSLKSLVDLAWQVTELNHSKSKEVK